MSESEHTRSAFRVEKVAEGSPAAKAGLVEKVDFIVAAKDIPVPNDKMEAMKGDTSFNSIVKKHEGKALSLTVFNSETKTDRKVTLTPSKRWEGAKGDLVGMKPRFAKAGITAQKMLDNKNNKATKKKAASEPETDGADDAKEGESAKSAKGALEAKEKAAAKGGESKSDAKRDAKGNTPLPPPPAMRSGYLVESIHPESPAAQLGLVAGADYIVQANGGAFSMESELPTDPADTPRFIALTRKFQDKPLKISIYSSTTLKDRVATIKPSRKWPGGETKGLLGMKIKFNAGSVPSEPKGDDGESSKSGKGHGAKEEKAEKEDGGDESDSSSGSDSDDYGGGGAEGGDADGSQAVAQEAEKKEEEGLSPEELAALKEKHKKDKKFAKKREKARVKAAKQKADKAEKEQKALNEATGAVEARETKKREALERKREGWERGLMERHDDLERFVGVVPVPAEEEEEGEGLWPPVPTFIGDGDDGGAGSVGTHSQPGSLQASEGKVSIFKGDPEQEAALKFAHHEVFETCRHGDLDGLKAVLADAPQCMEYSDFGGCTPLLLACMRRHIPCAEFLINQVLIVEAACAPLPLLLP